MQLVNNFVTDDSGSIVTFCISGPSCWKTDIPSSPPIQSRLWESLNKIVIRWEVKGVPSFSFSMVVKLRSFGLKRTKALSVPNKRLPSLSGRMAYTFSLISWLFSWLKLSIRPLLRWRTFNPPACVPIYTNDFSSSTYTALILLEPIPISRSFSCKA